MKRQVNGSICTVDLLPAFDDNYIFAGRNSKDLSTCFVVDPGSAADTLSWSKQNKVEIKAVLITHEHDDHLGGAESICNRHKDCKIYAHSALNKYFEGFMDRVVNIENGMAEICGMKIQCMKLPGHTADHMAYLIPGDKFLFCGDIAFGLGCGRVISGTYEEQYRSLQAIKNLPSDTKLFCAHEYSHRNLNFMKLKYKEFPDSFQKRNSLNEDTFTFIARALDQRISGEGATVPLTLEFEKKFNPFFTCESFEEFMAIRKLRNNF